jgi:soluble lytic murein transglycosylase
MPRVPAYQPNQVAPAATTGARVRAADMGRGGQLIAAGAGGLGEALRDRAAMQEDINLRFDDVESRKLAQRYQAGAARLVSEFEMAQGGNAYAQRGTVEQQLAKLREESLAGGSNARMRQMAADRIGALYDVDAIKIGEHATKQLTVEQANTLGAQVALSGEDAAANWDRPDLMAQHVATMGAAFDDLANLKGWSRETLAFERSKAVSAVHSDVVNRMLAVDDLDAAQTYLEANADALNAADELKLRGAMREPLLKREAQGDFERAVGGAAAAPPAKDGKPSSFAPPVAGGQQTSGFGMRKGRMHNGVDIAAPVGSSISPVAPGRVIEVKEGGASGKYVIVDHGDGHTSSYSHMGGFRVKVGDTVTQSSVLGTIGMTGRTTGPHVHLVVKRDGVAIDPAKVMGTNIAGRDQPRTWDKAAAFEQIDALADKERWTPERRERAKTIADREIQRDEELLSRQERQADREASEWVIANPGFTSISQMPAKIRDRLGPDARRDYMGVAERNANPKPVAANGGVVTMLEMMAIREPEAFARDIDLGRYVGQMTPAEFQALLLTRERVVKEMGAAGAKREQWTPRAGITGAISHGQKLSQLKLDDREYVAVFKLMESQVRDLHKAKGTVTPADYDAAFANATGTVARTSTLRDMAGMGPRAVPVYEVDLSRAELDAARERFKARMGREASDAEAEDLARRALLKPKK